MIDGRKLLLISDLFHQKLLQLLNLYDKIYIRKRWKEHPVKIGILGGTFNPIHNSHILLAQRAMEQLGLSKVLFVTSADPPHKDGNEIPSAQVRHRLVELAIDKYPYFEASTIEIQREGKSYTYYTLCSLKEMYPDDDLYFIVGGDSLSYLHTWYKAHELMQLCTFAVYPRGDNSGCELEAECSDLRELHNAECVILDAVPDNISSTEIRKYVHDGEIISDLVPKRVAEYINKNELYKSSGKMSSKKL